MKKKTPTLDARLASAVQAQREALSLFESAAVALDAADEAHSAIAAEALAEADRLTAVAEVAQAEADKSATAAAKIRDLIA